MRTLCDAHTHLDQFPDGEIPAILERARQVGVEVIITAGVTVQSSRRCIALADTYPPVWAGVGVHPMDLTSPLTEDDLASLESLARSSPKVAAVSEIGLDFSEGAPDLAWQYDAFRQQIRLARRLRLPIIFHSRALPGRPEAHQEVLRLLREEQAWEVGGAMHYFQADLATAQACLDLGFHISLAKPLLRLPHLEEVVRALPLSALVLETDSYPQPFKKRRDLWTEPKDVRLVAQKVAEVKGIGLDEVAEATTRNLWRLLKRPGLLPV
ncbi:putative metal-dependent hydrolase YcfH [bacterium HR23]|nr:putative metal-dependent hydrolase YcfH [bacterium HR23]